MLASDELQRVRACFPIVKSFTARQQQGLVQRGDTLTLEPQSVVFGIGSECHSFFFLTTGTLRVFMASEDGREILLYRVRPGQSCVLTTSCLLGRTTYPARGVTDSQVMATAIPGSFFQQLVAESDTFRSYVFTTYAERISVLISLVNEIAFKRLDRRLANHLLTLGSRSQVTHQALALELGTAREVISRVLKDFEVQDLVKLGRQQIQITDAAALRTIANS